MKKIVRNVLLGLLALVVLAAAAFAAFYFSRFQTIGSIQKLTDYEDYNIYRMDVKYDYDLDAVIAADVRSDQSMIDALLKQSLPLLPIQMKAPNFGCTAFTAADAGSHALMGRNYDFKWDTSAMLVYCTPKDGYKSVAFAALNNVAANAPEQSTKAKLAALTAPFICLDGMNEKGVSIAVLTLDSEPTLQNSGKPAIFTTLAIRLVLDRAATTEEAVALLQNYDMFATSGRDYHFYITDASGDGRVVEYDCNSPTREMIVTPSRAVTNFFVCYKDEVLPNQHNGVYGHGRERYDAVEEILTANEGALTSDVAWQALRAASQEPTEGDVTSNTQWSIVYDDTALTAEISLRRDWDNVLTYDLTTNQIEKK